MDYDRDGRLDLFVANYIDMDLATAPTPDSGLCRYKGVPVACGPPGLTGGKNVEVPWDKFAFKVCDLIFNLSTSYTSWDRAIALIASGLVPAEKLITHRAPLEEWDDLFTACEKLEEIKGLLIPA